MLNQFSFIAFLLVLLLQSCVPVRYDSQNWSELKSRGDATKQIAWNAPLWSTKGNALNNHNRAPWKVMLSAKSVRPVHIFVIRAILQEEGKRSEFPINRELPFSHHNNGRYVAQWKWEDFPLEVSPEFTEKRPIKITFVISIDHGSPAEVTINYKGKQITGDETVDLLTM